MIKKLTILFTSLFIFLFFVKDADAACWITSSTGNYNSDASEWIFTINENMSFPPYIWTCRTPLGGGCGESAFGLQSANTIPWTGDSDPAIPIHQIEARNGLGEICTLDVHVHEYATALGAEYPIGPHCGYAGSEMQTLVSGMEGGVPPETDAFVRIFSWNTYGYGVAPLIDVPINNWSVADGSNVIAHWTHPGDIDLTGGPWHYTIINNNYCEDSEPACSPIPNPAEWPSPTGNPGGIMMMPVEYCPPALNLLDVSPTSLQFTADVNGANPASLNFNINNNGSSTLNWNVSDDRSWISVNPLSGEVPLGPDSIAVSVDITGLPAGSYVGTVTVTSLEASNSPQYVTINLDVLAPPEISAFPSTLNFTAEIGEGDPAPQSFIVDNSQGGTLTWSVTDDRSWLSLIPLTGETPPGPDSVWVYIDVTGLAVGVYSGTATITDPGASNSPQTVTINLTVTTSSGIISGYVWDDISDNGTAPPSKLKNGSEINLVNPSIQIQLQQPLGNTIATTNPNHLGEYSFTGLASGSDYRVLITPSGPGWCDGTGGYGATGWNDGVNTNSYVNISSPYDSGDITVSSGSSTTVNLGLNTDYLMSVQPVSGDLSLDAGEQGVYEITLDAHPAGCWFGGDVTLVPLGVPPEIIINSIDVNPINPNGINLSNIRITVNENTVSGIYTFMLVAENGQFSPRSRQLELGVIVSKDPWVQMIGGDIWSSYNEIPTEPSIRVTLPPFITAPFKDYFMVDNIFPGTQGIPIARSRIEIGNNIGPKINEHNWAIENYPFNFEIGIDVNSLVVDTAIGNLSQTKDPNKVYRMAPDFPHNGSYSIKAGGVSLLYTAGSCYINANDFITDNPEREGLILLCTGDIWIRPEVGSNPPDPDRAPDITAVIMSLDDIIIEANPALTEELFLKIQGSLIAKDEIIVLRAYPDSGYPSVLVEYNPLYAEYPMKTFVEQDVDWREVISQ